MNDLVNRLVQHIVQNPNLATLLQGIMNGVSGFIQVQQFTQVWHFIAMKYCELTVICARAQG
jgi:hypothetical protein